MRNGARKPQCQRPARSSRQFCYPVSRALRGGRSPESKCADIEAVSPKPLATRSDCVRTLRKFSMALDTDPGPCRVCHHPRSPAGSRESAIISLMATDDAARRGCVTCRHLVRRLRQVVADLGVSNCGDGVERLESMLYSVESWAEFRFSRL